MSAVIGTTCIVGSISLLTAVAPSDAWREWSGIYGKKKKAKTKNNFLNETNKKQELEWASFLDLLLVCSFFQDLPFFTTFGCILD